MELSSDESANCSDLSASDWDDDNYSSDSDYVPYELASEDEDEDEEEGDVNYLPVSSQALLNRCINMVDKVVSPTSIGRLPCQASNHDIIADCDAFSWIVCADNDGSPTEPMLSPAKKTAIKKFLLTFATDVSTVTLATSAIAAFKSDSMFGSSHNQCQHLRSPILQDLLQSSESLVISAPVKLAVHHSCKDNTVSGMQCFGSKFYIPSSQNRNVCFSSGYRGNVPTYGIILDIVLSSSYVSSKNKFVIHVGNLGTRHPLSTQNECQVSTIFNSVQCLRRFEGIIVETTQIDIAFNFPIINHFVQWMFKKKPNKRKKACECVFASSATDVWPLHDIVCDHSGPMNQLEQKGTIRLKHAKWDVSAQSVVANHYRNYVNNEEFTCNENWEGMEYFKKRLINNKSIYSAKLYSTISHILRKNQNSQPLNRALMENIHLTSFQNLNRMVEQMQILFGSAVNFVSDEKIGIAARIEISIRPGTNDDLRVTGSFADILLMVHVAINDLFYHDSTHSLGLCCIPTEPVITKFQSLVMEILPFFKLRGNDKFNDTYNDSQHVSWLRAMLSCIMTTAGLAAEFKIKYIMQWMNENDDKRYDPTSQASHLRSTFLNVNTDTESAMLTEAPTIPERTLKELKKILDNVGISHLGTAHVIQHIRSDNGTPLECIASLCLQDKIIFAQKCNSEIIPVLISMKSFQNAPHVMHNDQKQLQKYHKWIHHEFPATNPTHMSVDFQHPVGNYEFLNSTMQLSHGRNNDYRSRNSTIGTLTPDPLLHLTHKLSDLNQAFDPNQNLYITRLFHHINFCHRDKIRLNNQLQLQPLKTAAAASTFAVAANIICMIPTDLSQKQLSIVCHGLGVSTQGIRDKISMVKKLASQYFFPCSSDISPNLMNVSKNASYQINMNVNSSIQAEIVTEIFHHNYSQRHFFRAHEKLHIFIPKREVLMTNYDDIAEVASSFESSDLYVVLDHLFIPGCTLGIQSRIKVHNHLLSLENIYKHFLLDNGRNNSVFDGISNIHELQSKKLLIILASDDISFSRYQCMNPDVILSTSVHLYESSIFFVDEVMNCSSLHVYDNPSEKVITYNFPTVGIQPKTKCHIIRKSRNNKFHVMSSRQMPTIEYGVIHLGRQHILSNIIFTDCSAVSHHPQKPMKKGGTCLVKTIFNLLKSESVSHEHFRTRSYNDEDPLDLKPYLGEFQFSFQDKSLTDLFSSGIVQKWCKIQQMKTIHDLSNFMRECDWMFIPHEIICSLMCIKYKLWFAVWEMLSPQKKMTHVYAFNSYTNIVECVTREGFSHSECSMFLYISVTKTKKDRLSTGYWECPQNNPFTAPYTKYSYSSLLKTPYSFLDGILLDRILHIFKTCVGMNISENRTIHENITQGRKKPTYMIMPIKDNDNVHIQFSLVIFYPFEIKTRKHCLKILSCCPEQETKVHLMKATEDMDYHIKRSFQVRSVMIQKQFSSAVMVLLYMYAANMTENHDVLTNIISDIQKEYDALNRAKRWLVDVLESNMISLHAPLWLKSIIQKYK